VKTQREFKYRHENFYVTSFSFHNNHKVLSALEFCIRIENKSNSLQLPNFKDAKEADDFYKKYVKRFSELAKKYKAKFNSDFIEFLKNNPETMKRFCDGSPYPNNELVQEIDMWGALLSCNKKYDYVYYKTPNNGYYFDRQGEYSYKGEIRNGKPNGKGNNKGWEGTFKDGKKTGRFNWYLTCSRYDWSNLGIGGFSYQWFQFKKTGTCVNDEWEGEVIYEITCPNHSTRKDEVKEYYSKGKNTKSIVVSKALSDDLREQERLARERDNEWKRQKEAERRRLSSVNENNVMQYVESISDYNDGEYKVVFKDGKSGYIKYNPSKGWGVECGWAFFFTPDYCYPEPNSKTAAILKLFKDKHDL
jgi:hypothetical protein